MLPTNYMVDVNLVHCGVMESVERTGPTGESKHEHTYDTNIIYHSHASNVPHINSWIDELVSLTEKGLPQRKFPTTQNLVDALQRYDAVYRELLRQTSIFSEPVTKQLAKVWAGSLKLLDFMVSGCSLLRPSKTLRELPRPSENPQDHLIPSQTFWDLPRPYRTFRDLSGLE